jgi:hypothetical protein
MTNPTIVERQTRCVENFEMAIEAVLSAGCSDKVVIEVEGPINTKRTENSPPYMSFSNNANGTLKHGKFFPAGEYEVTACLSGKESTEVEVEFTMKNC